MSVCWHRWIDTTSGVDPAPWTGSSQHLWSDSCSFLMWFILTAGVTFLAALPPRFCSSLLLSHFILFLPLLYYFASLLFPLHVGRMTSTCSHLRALCAGSRRASCQSRGQTGHCFSPALALLQRAEADSIVRVVQPTWLCEDARNGL